MFNFCVWDAVPLFKFTLNWDIFSDDCGCKNVFISAKNILSDRQGKVLGKYTRAQCYKTFSFVNEVAPK
jgi:hypothetical protein